MPRKLPRDTRRGLRQLGWSGIRTWSDTAPRPEAVDDRYVIKEIEGGRYVLADIRSPAENPLIIVEDPDAFIGRSAVE